VSFLQAVRTSKNPPALMVLIGGGAAILGLAFVAAATWASARLGWHAADGCASIAIGLVLAAMSGFVANESKSLLIGEQADERLRQSIAQLASAEAGVVRAAVRFTVQLAPDQVAAALAIQFAPDLKAAQIETAAARIEQAIARAHPQVVSVMLTPRQVSPGPGRRVGNEPITHCER
jgi:divalent metal cation (Fe/Co/Zn/Cd) transporter